MFHEGVIKRGLPIPLISRLLSGGPAERFGLSERKGVIALGMDADFALLHPAMPYTIRTEDLQYRHKHSPYVGMTLSCRVTATLLRGRLIYSLEDGVLAPDSGRRVSMAEGQPVL
ncbi:Allantoinase [compost metagenome]